MKPNKYNSLHVRYEISVSMRQAQTGELFYLVEYEVEGSFRFVTFQKMSSVLDFIHSNF